MTSMKYYTPIVVLAQDPDTPVLQAGEIVGRNYTEFQPLAAPVPRVSTQEHLIVSTPRRSQSREFKTIDSRNCQQMSLPPIQGGSNNTEQLARTRRGVLDP